MASEGSGYGEHDERIEQLVAKALSISEVDPPPLEDARSNNDIIEEAVEEIKDVVPARSLEIEDVDEPLDDSFTSPASTRLSGSLHHTSSTPQRSSLMRSCCRNLNLADIGQDPATRGRGKVTTNSLHQASLHADPELVRRLISTGASVNVPIFSPDPDGDVFVTLLHVLSSRPDLPRGAEVIAEIARGKANLNARSSLGCTPLARACLHKNFGAAELLLELGADPSPLDDRGRSALHCSVSLEIDTNALMSTTVESLSGGLVTLLAGKNADLECGGGAPPLLEAIQQANRPAVVALIQNGARPQFLHVAVDKAPAVLVDDLLKGQANPLEEDHEGKTVLDIALERGDEEITTLLRDFIGDWERKHHNSASMVGQAQPMVPMAKSNTEGMHASQDLDVDDNTLGFSCDFERRRRGAIHGSSSEDAPRGRRSQRRFSLGRSSLLNRKKSQDMQPAELSAHEPSVMQVFLKEKFAKFQLACRRANRNRNFQMVMMGSLLAALFFPDLWIICDMESNDGLDIVLVLVFSSFVIELAVQTIGMPKTYINSFFFWMDVVGLLSVPLDHSLVSDSLPRSLDNAVVMRAARTARLGARAGRFTKLVKLLRFLPGVSEEATGVHHGTAKKMSTSLMTSLSTRVSCLIIVMVMVLPLFEMATYPENDYSMKAWMNSLDFSFSRHGIGILEQRVFDFESFYDDKDYYPIEIFWETSNGTQMSRRLKGKRPRRDTNKLQIKADSGLVHAVFNFGAKNRVDALCNMILMVVIILLMMGFSLLLSNSVSAIVLQPLENLLTSVQAMASKIFTSVTSMAANCTSDDAEAAGEREEDESGDLGNETELLEKVIEKLATLSAITMKTSPIDAETLEQLGEGDRAVLQGFSPDHLPAAKAREDRVSRISRDSSSSRGLPEDHTEELVTTLETHLEEAGLVWGLVDSWEFNALDIEEQQRHLACLCFIVFHLGLGYTGKQQAALMAFIEAAAAGYNDPGKVPYHNWYHAVDVTHCVFRLLNLCAAERFFSNYERFALVTSAVCHDIGHPGMNNPFLIETAHELAIRYNDHSPLENMHCAKLFELVSQPKSAVFGSLDRQQYKEVRQVCIEAILHTDNIHHFGMVKELQMLYEMNSDVFDLSLQMCQTSQLDFPPREIVDIFVEPERKKSMRNLFLHFADISNPMKPWDICHSWAWCIIDEFFIQGDREKELGISVQPLNDRDKVNKPYSQVGFIEFFVAPFAFATVRLLPPLVTGTDQMMLNVSSWCQEWLATTFPPPEQEDIAKLQERIAKLEAKFVFRDGF